jgi:isopropylmalate/homocitrate/citramalate synthase
MNYQISTFDTDLRGEEQIPSRQPDAAKVEIAKKLESLGVNVAEVKAISR